MNRHPDTLAADPEVAPILPPKSAFGWMLALDSVERRQYERFSVWARQTTAKLARAGVTIGTGTDIWEVPTGVHLELEEMVAAGLSPLEALHAATGAAAEIIGADHDLGTIEAGKLADLVLLEADPSSDIRATRRIRAVVLGGQVVYRSADISTAGP
jgi:imidazolonepropionase-like amidohydrolase